MDVIKRDGSVEPFNFSKIEKVVRFACHDQEDVKSFLDSLEINIKNRMSTKDIQNTLIKVAAEKTSVQEPQWQFVASRLFLYDLYKKAGNERGYKAVGYGSFYSLVKMLTDNGFYGAYITDAYSKKDIDELGKYIEPKRDDLFTYAAIQLLSSRYLVKGFDREIYELPQERFMIIAMTLAIPEKQENRVKFAKEVYDCISKHEFMVATPTLMNSGRPHKQLSSCYISATDDDLWSIYDVNANIAQLSKYSGGIGLYIGHIRSVGQPIKGFKGVSRGIFSWIKGYEVTARAVNQLGSRDGSAAIYLDVWHPDIFSFLQLKTNNGDPEMKAFGIHPAVNIPDMFMKAVEERKDWHLIDPHEVYTKKGYRLEDSYGEEFERKYLECVEDSNIEKRTVSAIDIMRKLLESAYETGEPFLFFRDTANRDNPNKHAGMVYSSNLCSEVIQNFSHSILEEEVINGDELIVRKKLGDTVVCNLSSINLGKIKDEDDLKRIIPIQVRALDNVIDLNFYPIKEAEYSNKRYRAIGLGTMGLHHYLANRGIKWESQDHLDQADSLYSNIAYYTIQASMELAKEKGQYPLFNNSDWHNGSWFERRSLVDGKWAELAKEVSENGLRNGYLMATAPTSSISIVANTTSTTDPIFNKFYIEEKKEIIVPMVAPDLNQENFWLYKEAHNIDQMWSIRAQSIRQKYIDQGNSFNLYINTSIKASSLLQYYLEAWKQGLKSVYYVRNQTLDVEECVSCT